MISIKEYCYIYIYISFLFVRSVSVVQGWRLALRGRVTLRDDCVTLEHVLVT